MKLRNALYCAVATLTVTTALVAMDVQKTEPIALYKEIIEEHDKTTATADDIEITKEEVQRNFHTSEQILRQMVQQQQMAKDLRLDMAKWSAFFGLLFLASLYKLYKAVNAEIDKYQKKLSAQSDEQIGIERNAREATSPVGTNHEV